MRASCVQRSRPIAGLLLVAALGSCDVGVVDDVDELALPAYGRLDSFGVEMLFPSAPDGSRLALGTKNLRSAKGFSFDGGAVPTPVVEGPLRFWNVVAYSIDYASSGSGSTVRLNLRTHEEPQRFTWRTEPGYLSTPADVKNLEVTVYVRVHELVDAARAQATLKIRSGRHSGSDPDAGSCTMMTLAPATALYQTRFGKELVHPLHDYVPLTPKRAASLVEGAWVGLKVVSWNVPSTPPSVINRLYVDPDPFDEATGAPKNGWRLLSEYRDVEGKSTGHYSKLVDWGGWQTTLRIDGYRNVDIAYPSVREIVPPI